MRRSRRSVPLRAALFVLAAFAVPPFLSSSRASTQEFQGIWYRTPEKRGAIAVWLATGTLSVGSDSVSFESKKVQLAIPTASITKMAPADYKDDPAHTWIQVDYDEGGSARAAAFTDGHIRKGDTGAVYEAITSAMSAQAASTLPALHTTRIETLYYTNETIPKNVWRLLLAPRLEDALLRAYASGDTDDLYRYNIIVILSRRSVLVKDEEMRKRIHDCLIEALQKDGFGWVKVESLDALKRLGDEKEALAQADILLKSDKDAAIHDDVAKWVRGVTPLPSDDLVMEVCTDAEARKFEAQGNKDKSEMMARLVCQMVANSCRDNSDQDPCKNTLRKLDAHLHASGSSMLSEAARRGRTDIVKTMIGLGADVNEAKADGATALMAAAGEGHVEAVQALLAAGADAALKDRDGRTALALAESKGHPEVAGLLKERTPGQ